MGIWQLLAIEMLKMGYITHLNAICFLIMKHLFITIEILVFLS